MRWRGVSRKISGIMPWIVPGATRVFLASAPDARGSCHGLIRGYFIVAQVQRLSDFESDETGVDAGQARVERAAIEDLLRLETDARTRPKPGTRRKPGRTGPDPESDDDEEPECLDGDTGTVGQGSKTVSQVCRLGRWEDATKDGSQPVVVPVSDEVLAEHRSCSVRQVPGAIYLVDALCAQITNAFPTRVAASDIKKRFASDSLHERLEALDEAHWLFETVVQHVHRQRAHAEWPPARVPAEIVGKVSVRGDLVLFTKPLAFEMHPKVELRSLVRVDGDDIVSHVRAGRTRIRPRICADEGARHMTRTAMVAGIAAKNSLNRSAVADVLDDLATLVAEEVAESGLGRIPGIGSVSVHERTVVLHPHRGFIEKAVRPTGR